MEEDRVVQYEEVEEENRIVGPASRWSCARGGPIFAPDLVGPLSSVPDFKISILHELYCLQADLLSSPGFDHDLLVDELKVLTEDQLVEEALQPKPEDGIGFSDEALQAPEQSDLQTRGEGTVVERECSSERSSSRSDEGASNLSIVTLECTPCGKNAQQGKKRKKGRHFDREIRATQLEGAYLERVRELLKLKQKQDEDKLAARLHSFCGEAKSSDSATSTSANSERTRSLRFSTAPVKAVATRPGENDPVSYPEVSLCVEIYHAKRCGTKTQEFLVLGSQKLTDLRDNIYCLTDNLMKAAGKYDPSAYFLIEDTFYNDMRDYSAIDYSRSIIDWLENSQEEALAKWDAVLSGTLKKKQKELLGDLEASSLPKFKTKHMEKTCFSDLKFRLGNGYLYCHQGNCKHMMVIRDMRLLDQEDPRMQGDYPMLIFQLIPRYRKCSVCRIYHATKMTVDDKWAPVNPCYLCTNCYFLLHCKEDNTFLYPHEVFDYHQE